MDGTSVVVFVVLLFSFLDCTLGEYCRERYYSVVYGDYRYRDIHCTWGCCGSSNFDEYCCVGNAGIIVGIVFAAIFGISLLSAFICCFIKHKGSRGRVVGPMNRNATTTIVGPHASNNVFIVPSGQAPPPYSVAAYNATSTYPPYSLAPSAPMPPAYNMQTTPPAYNYTTPYPPAYSTVAQTANDNSVAHRFNGGK